MGLWKLKALIWRISSSENFSFSRGVNREERSLLIVLTVPYKLVNQINYLTIHFIPFAFHSNQFNFIPIPLFSVRLRSIPIRIRFLFRNPFPFHYLQFFQLRSVLLQFHFNQLYSISIVHSHFISFPIHSVTVPSVNPVRLHSCFSIS